MNQRIRTVTTVASSAALILASVNLLARQSPGQTGHQPSAVSALVGGTLIDGFGGPVIRNSVILIEGERIKAVGKGDVLRHIALLQRVDVVIRRGVRHK